jgi:hypothetical protein
MDVALLCIEYASFLILETALKGVFYSVKLKLEFAILGRLVKFVCSGQIGIINNACLANNGSCHPLPSPPQPNQCQKGSPELYLERWHTQNLENLNLTKPIGDIRGTSWQGLPSSNARETLSYD